jgi:Tol biopolymer transport system component
MRNFIAVLAVVSTARWLLAVPAGAPEPRLVYPCNQDGQVRLVLIKPNGTVLKSLSGKAGPDTDPAWSPDGKKIAFAADRGAGPGIFVMDARGENVKQLTRDNVRDRAPAWSPDGKKIAFIRHVDNTNPEIFVMNADGSNAVNLTKHPAYDADPTWSPDGKKIAFVSDRAGDGFRILVMDADGANVAEVTKKGNGLGYVYPAWSPDGKKIAFADAVPGGMEIFVIAPDGGNRKQLTKLGGNNSLAAWSPDGKKIAFQHVLPGENKGRLYMMDADGGNAKAVGELEGPVEGARPAWAPRKR